MSDTAAAHVSDRHQPGVDNACTIASVVIGSGVALLALYLGPILVSEYIVKLGVSQSRAGLIMSTEMTGFTLGSAMLFALSGIDWRKYLGAALMLMVMGNLLCSFVDSLSFFVPGRFIAGLGSGMVMTMTIQVIGLMRDPDRVYGMWSVGQLSFGALGMMIFPGIIAVSGINMVFFGWALLAAVLFFSVRYYPRRRTSALQFENQTRPGRQFVPGAKALLGLFIYYGGQAGVWVYMERLGLSWGIARDFVGQALFVSLLAAIAGASVAIFLGDRIGRAVPLVASLGISALSIITMIFLDGGTVFILAACLFNFGWYLFLPYISAIVAAVDDNGKLLTGLAVTFPAGLAAGPAIAALLIGNAESLTPALGYGLLSVPLGLVLMLPAARIKPVTT